MIKSRGLPTAIDVALPAIVSECAAMPILLAMATDASLLQPLLAVGTGMTGSALGLGMAACEGKSGACVIEVLYLPAVAVVTLRAVLAQAAIVRVVATMTGLARSEEQPSELQTLMRISYAVFCLKKQQNIG